METAPKVISEFITAGPISATATADASFLVIDFVGLEDRSTALRLGIPSESLQTTIDVLIQFQKALADPASGIHFQPRH